MHKHRITIEALGRTTGGDGSESQVTRFDAEHHDDLLRVIDAVRSKGILDPDAAAALAVGLKLFSEAVLKNRRDPLFAAVFGPVRTFTEQLKALPATTRHPAGDDARTTHTLTLEAS